MQALALTASDPSQPLNASRLTVMFLNLDIGRERTGIENAALLRARLFEKHLGIIPHILTVKYDAHFPETRTDLLDRELNSDSTVFRNLYDDFQELGEADGQPRTTPAPERLAPAAIAAGFAEKPVAGTPDWRIYDQQGRCVQYRKCSPSTSVLQYINFIARGKRWRRDTFTPSGILTRIQYLDPATGESLCEHYLRPDGSAAIVQLYTLHGQQRQLAKISLLDRQGQFQNEFETQEQFAAFWLDRLTSDRDQIYVTLIDKNRVYYRSLVDLKFLGGRDNIKIVPIVHAVHTKNGFEIQTSGTNINYADILHEINKPDAIVVGTQQQRDDIARRYGDGIFHVIPPACSEDRTTDNSSFSSRRQLEVVYVARYSEEKNHNLAVRAFAKVVDAIPAATLQMYGSGGQKNTIRQLVTELGLQESVFVNDYAKNVKDIFCHAGLSILTSQGEGYSLAVMESLSCGCPVVAFDVRYGPAETIIHGVSGALVPFGDTGALADQIIQILSNESLHRQMCENASLGSLHFQGSHVADRWRRLVNELADA